MGAWFKPQVEALDHRVKVLSKISKQHTQSDYSGLGMLLQLKLQYLKRNVPAVVTLMGCIEGDLRDKFFPAIFRGEEVDADFQKNPRP